MREMRSAETVEALRLNFEIFHEFEERGIQFSMPMRHSYWKHDREQGPVDIRILNDRDERAGVKFNDADLIGIPLRIIVGGRGLADGVVELKWRTDDDARRIPLDQIVATISDEIAARTAVEADAVPE